MTRSQIPTVLSLQLPTLGNRVFGELLRASFADSDLIDFQAAWLNDEPELWAKVINGTLRLRPPLPRSLLNLNIDLWRFRVELGYGLYARRLIGRYRSRRAVDVLHFNTQTASMLASGVMAALPSVLTLDQTAKQIALETPQTWRWTHAPSVALESLAFKRAAAIVPFSLWAAKSLIEQYGVEPSKITVIPIGVDLEKFSDLDPTARYRDGDRPLIILFVGGDFKRKGGQLLVDVFISEFSGLNIELHLVTNEYETVSHDKIIVHRDVKPYSDRWKKLYQSASIFALPTLWEGFGMAFTEAMAAGLPTIGTNVSAIPEIIADGVSGFIIERHDKVALADRLRRLIEDKSLRQELGGHGLTRVGALFDARKNAQRLADVFRDVHSRNTVVSRR